MREEESLDAIEGRVLLLVLLLEMAEMGCSLGVICAGVSLSRFWRSEFFFFACPWAIWLLSKMVLMFFLLFRFLAGDEVCSRNKKRLERGSKEGQAKGKQGKLKQVYGVIAGG